MVEMKWEFNHSFQ